MYKVRYTDNTGCEDCTVEFTTKEAAEKAIEDGLIRTKELFTHDCKDYDYADFGTKTEIWIPGEDVYCAWERLWK